MPHLSGHATPLVCCIVVIAQTHIVYMVATISGMFKIDGRPSAKTDFSSLLFLFTQLCRAANFCFRQFVHYAS